MEYKDDSFLVVTEKDTINFSGKIEKSEYTELSDFLDKFNAEHKGTNLDINLSKLAFLNSSGIRTIALFLMKCKKRVKLIIDSTIAWQKYGIEPLVALRPQGEIVVEK